MKYIFVAGAPGSKWSSVVKNIYYSPDVDRSDYSEDRLYYHDASGKLELMHLGAYFDPGMEFGTFFDKLEQYTKEECEAEFDRAFAPDSNGVRIIKSHVFSEHIDFIRQTWPECPIVLVYRSNDSCLGWWVNCGHFDITYPNYDLHYVNLKHMSQQIKQQNFGITDAIIKYRINSSTPDSNAELCAVLGITLPPVEYQQYYKVNDIIVKVIK